MSYCQIVALRLSKFYLKKLLTYLLTYHIRQLRCIHPYLDTKTASTIATSIVHSKLDYCNSLYHNLPKSQITRLKQIQKSLARVSKFPNPVTSLPSSGLYTS